MYSSIVQSLLCGNSPKIEVIYRLQGFIVIESDPEVICKGISEILYRGIILNTCM